MDQPPPYVPAPAPGFGSTGFPGFQSYPAQPFYYQGAPGSVGAPGGSWPYSSVPAQDSTVYLMKPEERSPLPGFGSALSGRSPGFVPPLGLSPGLGGGRGGGLKSFLGACSAALCCCCLWDLLHR